MNWKFIVEESIVAFAQGAKLALFLGFCAILLSLIIGLICSIVIYYKIPVLKTIAKIYIELSRNTPSLVQLFFLYYGLPKIGVMISAEMSAIVALSFLGGSYMAESFRSGLETVTRTQIESGMSIGLKRSQIFCHIIIPESLITAVPSLGANAIFLLKETSIVSAVALADITFVAKDIIGTRYYTTEALFMMVLSYLIILSPLVIGLYFIEKKVRRAHIG